MRELSVSSSLNNDTEKAAAIKKIAPIECGRGGEGFYTKAPVFPFSCEID